MKRKTKNLFKKAGTALLAVGVLAGVSAGGKALYDYSNDEMKTIHPTFYVGGLDVNGEYVKTDKSLYSSAFECKGLEISLDFDNDINYEVYFYESDGDYVLKSGILDDDSTLNDLLSQVEYFSLVSHARVVIIPQWTNLEIPDDKTEEDVKVVKWTNISSFVKQLEIKVSKNQDEVYDLLSNNKGEILKNSIVNPGGIVNETDEKINVFSFAFNCTHNYKITYPKKFDISKLNNILGCLKTKSSPDQEFQTKTIFHDDELKDNSFFIDLSEYKNDYSCNIFVNYLEDCQPIIEIIPRNS